MNNQTVTSSSDLKTFGSGLIDKRGGSPQVGGTPTRKQSFQSSYGTSERKAFHKTVPFSVVQCLNSQTHLGHESNK